MFSAILIIAFITAFIVMPVSVFYIHMLYRAGSFLRKRDFTPRFHPSEVVYREDLSFTSQLSPALLRKYNKRLSRFLNSRHFEGRQELNLSRDMMEMLAHNAVRLTFGLLDFTFEKFTKILFYPGIYYSPFTETYNKGETNPQGIIALSWEHLKQGNEVAADGINLGFHELAHALVLQYTSGNFKDLQFDLAYHHFSEEMQENRLAQKAMDSGILRDYAFTNKMEFIAVSTEVFMETPVLMAEKCPVLYDAMCRMLRQDPIRMQFGIAYRYDDRENLTEYS